MRHPFAGRGGAGAATEAHGIRRHVSALDGILPYRREWLSRDVVAGLTLAALAIPEVLGYAKIAGTPTITGLYTILLPIMVFALLGSSRHLVVGGDSATAAIMYAGIAGLGVAGLQPGTDQWLAYASLAALITGGLLLLARLARLGFLADFISRTVLIGFLTGVGIQVALGQIGGMLGIPKPDTSGFEISGTLKTAWDTLTDLGSASGATALVSLCVLLVLVGFSKFIPAIPGGLVAVVGAILVSWAADLAAHGVSVLGPVPSGLPSIGLPAGLGWSEVPGLLTACVSMFLVIIAQSAATSRAYAVRYQEPFQENTDIVGLAASNVAAGLSGTFVVNGSPTKTEMVDEAKSHTQVAQLTTGVAVALVLLFLTGPLEYLPNAVLSSVVFLIGLKLVEIAGMKEVWRLRRDEFWIAAATAAVVVCVGVEQGIILAIVLSILMHVSRHYRPKDEVVGWDASGRPTAVAAAPGAETEPGLVLYRFDVGIFFANAARLGEEVLAIAAGPAPPRWIVLVADGVDDVDFTGGKTLLELADQLRERGIVFGLAELDASVRDELVRYGVIDHVGAEHVFDTRAAARDAFRAAAP